MKRKRLACAFLLVLLTLPLTARADGLIIPRNRQSEIFVELYQKDITGWDSANNDAIAGVKKCVYWTYPGSGKVKTVVNHSAGAMEQGYVDSWGRLWGYVSYDMGHKQGWVCVSDSTNEHIPADTEVVAAVRRAMLGENLPAILLVAGVVVITGGLLCRFWYKGRKKV